MKFRVIKYFKTTAFTLIELLVVISVIALLLGLLIPALGRARIKAKEVVCQSRLRQWAFAFETYANKNDGFFPHIDGLERSKLGADNFGWVDLLPPLMGHKAWRDHKYGERPGKNTIFQCPSSKIVKGVRYKYYPDRTGYFSYAMNSCLELDGSCWPPNYPYPDTSGLGNNMPSFLQTAKIKNPQNIILLFEQLLDPRLGYNGKKQNPWAGYYCGSYPRAFSARHKRKNQKLGGFILYCDYHIEWKNSVWKDEWPDDLEVPPRSDTNWFPY